MINKIDFKAKNLTSNAGLFLLLENAKSNGIFDFIENDLVFDNDSTNKIKMNHIKTMLCGHFIGIDKLERLKLLQNDPLVNEFDISVKEPETVSRFLGNFNFKTTQMFRDINFKVFKKLLTKSKLTSITIDIDSSVIADIHAAASCISRTTSSISPEQATRTFGGSSLSIRSPGAV